MCRRRQAGFTYLGLLALIVLIGILLAAAGQVSATNTRRERERELLFVGHAYRVAIQSYFQSGHRYPVKLADLLDDTRSGARLSHHLRQLYRDPITGTNGWTLLPAPDGGIMGVASPSNRAPLKQTNFDDADRTFSDATTYGDWQFAYLPGVLRTRGCARNGAQQLCSPSG